MRLTQVKQAPEMQTKQWYTGEEEEEEERHTTKKEKVTERNADMCMYKRKRISKVRAGRKKSYM